MFFIIYETILRLKFASRFADAINQLNPKYKYKPRKITKINMSKIERKPCAFLILPPSSPLYFQF